MLETNENRSLSVFCGKLKNAHYVSRINKKGILETEVIDGKQIIHFEIDLSKQIKNEINKRITN